MSNFIYLMIIVIGATLIWPVNRWAVHHNARPEVLGLCISTAAVIIGIISALATDQPLLVPEAVFFGAIAGIAYQICQKAPPARGGEDVTEIYLQDVKLEDSEGED